MIIEQVALVLTGSYLALNRVITRIGFCVYCRPDTLIQMRLSKGRSKLREFVIDRRKGTGLLLPPLDKRRILEKKTVMWAQSKCVC